MCNNENKIIVTQKNRKNRESKVKGTKLTTHFATYSIDWVLYNKNQDPGEQNLLVTKTALNIGQFKPKVKIMSLFPDYLELQRNQSWAIDQKSDSHIPRNSMNKLVMDYLITGIY